MMSKSETPENFTKLKPTLVWLEMSLLSQKRYMLLSTTMGMAKHSHLHHLTAILSPIPLKRKN